MLISDIIAGKSPLKRYNKKAMICIDYGNWRDYLRERQIWINWKEFRDIMNQIFTTTNLYYYDGIKSLGYMRSIRAYCTQEELNKIKDNIRNFHSNLKGLGYTVRSKPISMIYKGRDHAKEPKCNFDVEITMDIIENISRYDVFVLCTGDSDFVPLVKKLKENLKLTYAISIKNRFSSELKNTVNFYDYLNKLITYVPDLTYKK